MAESSSLMCRHALSEPPLPFTHLLIGGYFQDNFIIRHSLGLANHFLVQVQVLHKEAADALARLLGAWFEQNFRATNKLQIILMGQKIRDRTHLLVLEANKLNFFLPIYSPSSICGSVSVCLFHQQWSIR